jgi:hypothetical protein
VYVVGLFRIDEWGSDIVDGDLAGFRAAPESGSCSFQQESTVDPLRIFNAWQCAPGTESSNVNGKHCGVIDMTGNAKAAHVLGSQYPELMEDAVSEYVSALRKRIGDAASSAVYSTACRSAPLPDNPIRLKRGSVVEIKGEKYLSLGSGFMTLEFASLDRAGTLLSVGPAEFANLEQRGFRVLDEQESQATLNLGPA